MISLVTIILAISVLSIWAAGIWAIPAYLSAIVLAVGLLMVSIRKNDKKTFFPLSIIFLFTIGYLFFSIIPTSIPRHSKKNNYEQLAIDRDIIAQKVGDTLDKGCELNLISTKDYNISRSFNRAGTIRIIILLISMYCTFMLVVNLREKERWYLLYFLTFIATLLSVQLLLQTYLFKENSDLIWWCIPSTSPHHAAVFGNPNHFGAFLAMCLCGAITIGVKSVYKNRWKLFFLIVLVVITITAAVITTQSRGAFIIFIVALVGCGLFSFNRRNYKVSISFAIFSFVGIFSVAFLTSNKFDNEMRSFRDSQVFSERTLIWQIGKDIFNDYPVTGCGAEGYKILSTKYANIKTDRRNYAQHCENSYLQVAADFGIIGILLLATFLMMWVRYCWQSIKERQISSYLRIAGCGGVFVVFVHAIYDFPMHIPLYALVTSVFFALLMPVRREKMENLSLSTYQWQHRFTSFVAFTMVMVVVVFGLKFGRLPWNRDRYDWIKNSCSQELAECLTWSPCNWAVWYHFGRQVKNGKGGKEDKLYEQCLTRAAYLFPYNGDLWRELAITREFLRMPEKAKIADERYLKLIPDAHQKIILKKRRKIRKLEHFPGEFPLYIY